MTRREAMSLLVPGAFGALLLPEPAAAQDLATLDTLYPAAEWVEIPTGRVGHERCDHQLTVGVRVNDKEVTGISGRLFQYSNLPGHWTFRCGSRFADFTPKPNADLESAKRLAERQMIEWLRSAITVLEKLTYPVPR